MKWLWLLAAMAMPLSAGEAVLAEAAERGDRELLEKLLAEGAAVDTAQVDGMTALLWAAHGDDLASVEKLLAAGAGVNAANRYGVTAISLACENGNAAMVEVLLKAGAAVNAKLAGGETALMTASRTGLPDGVKVLLENGAEVDAVERGGQTALMWAAAEGHGEVVRLLLEAGADLKRTLKSGFTPLLFAVRQGQAEVVGMLLDAGADVSEAVEPKRGGGRLPGAGIAALMMAVENGHFELALELVDRGADPNDLRSGFAPLHAVSWVRRTELGDGLNGTPPPEGSGEVDSLEFVRRMVASGADVNVRVKKGRGGPGRVHTEGVTPFLLAAKADDLEFLKVLVALGADPAIANSQGTTPLLAAAGIGVGAPGEEPGTEAEAIATVDYLMELGADINAVDQNGETVMHAAAYKAVPGLIAHLDAKGADIKVWNRENRYGWTPLEIGWGYRPGNFRPIQETVDALVAVMERHGVAVPPRPAKKP